MSAPDPDLVAGCNATAAVFYDANASGAATGLRGGAEPDWRPVPGKAAVRMVLAQDKADTIEQDGLALSVVRWLGMFPDPLELDQSNYIQVYFNNTPSRVFNLFVTGRSEDTMGLGAVFYCEFHEYASPKPQP